MVFIHSGHNLNTVQASKPTESQPAHEVIAMKEMMADLLRQIKEIKVTLQQKPRRKTPSRQWCPQTPSRCRKDNLDICWYHQTYGDQAKKCKPHCKYTSDQEN